MRNHIWLMFALLCSALQAQPLPSVTSGRIERLADFASRYVDARHVDVWLPEGYTPAQRYQVLYMHDGQMLFDAATTWNKQAWGIDRTVSRLVQEGRIAPTIVVGIWNNGKFRYSEYFPQKHLQFLPVSVQSALTQAAMEGTARADNY
ncbi:MAG: esterase, partial [Candidatus Saccharibacteria bacterium]|nr:esterase [Rhodoferax sp.]